jgi:hypothetical protein
MSSVRISEFERLKEELPGYLTRAKNAKSQPTKEFTFASFIHKVFGITSEDFSEKMEVSVVSKVLLMRGRVDAVFGNLLLEFKIDLDREIDDARREFTKYFQALKEKYPTMSYIGIATDDIKFKVFKPAFDAKGRIREVSEIDSLDVEREKSQPEKIYLWFDSYLFISEKTPPTTEDLRRRFGVESPTFVFIRDELQQQLDLVSESPAVRTKFENWEKYLEIVYGDKLASSDLFVKHTYVSLLAKVIVYLHLYGGKATTKKEIPEILNGDVFRQYGITNFIEEDFFAWILTPQILDRVAEITTGLIRELIVYDLAAVDEDVFKEFYQELVDPDIRHGLGEYYTPDWLAEYMLTNIFSSKPMASILDPACGSGTFLFTAIRLKSKQLGKRGMPKSEILSHVIDNVVGMDIHPLAVIISRTNYLLALRNLLKERREGAITIPVYLSDSIKLPEFASEVQHHVKVYKIEASEKSYFAIPEIAASEPSLLDDVIDKMYHYSKRYELGGITKEDALEAFSNAISSHKDRLRSEGLQVFERDLKMLLGLIDRKSNSIWTFILRNIYRPVTLNHRKFDVLAGNPPWIALNIMKNSSYQLFLKESSVKMGIIDNKKPHLFTHMEIATLFYLTCTALYLKKKGIISFVMPATMISGDQHSLFRNANFTNVRLGFRKLIDLSNVEPLFNVKSCVLESEFEAITKYPIDGIIVTGRLSKKNSSFEDAKKQLRFDETAFELESVGTRNFLRQSQLAQQTIFGRSWYFERFREGATIVPRPFWFVDVVRHPIFGVDLERPLVKSGQRSKEKGKKQYQDVNFEGQIEARFLYRIVTGSEMIPFGLTGTNLGILPIEPKNDKYRIIQREEAETRGYNYLAKWLSNAEKTWMEKRATKAKGPSIYKWIDYRRKLTEQNPKKRYAVIYEAVGTYLVATVVDKKKTSVDTSEGKVQTNGTVIDYSTIYYEANDEDEAHYLCAVLNSKKIDDIIKPLQAPGLWGPRNIWKKVLEIPIPKFDPKSKIHRRLAEIARECETKVELMRGQLSTHHNIGKVRSTIRGSLGNQLAEVTEMTAEILSKTSKKKARLMEFA